MDKVEIIEEEEQCTTPTHREFRIPAQLKCPPPPPKKKPRRSYAPPPKNGYFHPPDNFEALFTMGRRRTEACL
ncbi:hypothetical protein ACSBR1_035507 [Camellia fascicularis]